ncbi:MULTISPECIES: MerR family transcriptional regulator [unclassified Crossiella]|uniref:MerR family transcriptional regulator n=1 Tax=unclassified Crossiella TaxID=2620835 RepID=UPI001FFEABC9|nr:MerR family transcriptional regulator [Crossiella sp. S99.2]MCK2257976.1 MerR family transcriptional regulator [Crossiella sp. S99.1]
MRTGELAARAGVNPQTLRYYERRGLLAPPRRSTSGYRDYPPDALARLRFIKRAQALGFTLEETEELLHLADGGPASCDTARTLATARLADIEDRVADLTRMREALSELVTRCDLPRPDRACGLLHTLREQTGESS